MSGMYGQNREAVRVKVKKCEKNVPSETRKFSVDPQITNLEVLYSLLAKAFDLRTDFGISYRVIEANGQESYLVVLSDWDLEAAFLRAHNQSIATKSEPCLNLRVDIKPFSEASEWDGNSTAASSSIPRELASLQQSIGAGQKYVQTKLPGLIMNQMEKTFSMVQRAFNMVEDPLLTQPIRPPLADAEFRNLQDSVGQIVAPEQLRKVIYLGGIDPSLRRVVWKHILNVYPDGMTGRERMEYMKKKSAEYYRLRDIWRSTMQRGNIAGELAYVTSMVRKDVLRTDRLHPFYAGSDDNQNIAALFNVLTTYALNHPAVSYCQGMSDIASPLLVTMGDEAQAYICFCAVMQRLSCNFMLDGIAMTLKFSHLSEALQYYDPDFFSYLKHHQADDLLFCYRWLLLEMKREFAFDDALRMLEVLWSSLPPMAPQGELALFEKEYEPPPAPDAVLPPSQSPSVMLRTPRENPYTKVCALRRQSSALSLSSSCTSTNPLNISGGRSGQGRFGVDGRSLEATRRLNLSLDENITREKVYSTAKANQVQKVHQSLDEAKIALVKQRKIVRSVGDDDNIQEVIPSTDPNYGDTASEDNVTDVEDSVFHSPQHQAKLNSCNNNPFISDSIENVCNAPAKPEPATEECEAGMAEAKELATVPQEESLDGSTPTTNNSSAASSVRNSPVIGRSRSLFSTSATGKLIARQLSQQKKHFTSTTPSTGSTTGHFHDLKEKLAAGRKGIFASLDKSAGSGTGVDPALSSDAANGVRSSNEVERAKPKLVKNFNEFLNFAAINKSRISDRLATKKLLANVHHTSSANSVGGQSSLDSTSASSLGVSQDESTETIEYNELKPKPVIKLTKSSFDDSDSSATSVGVGGVDSMATTTALSRSSDNSSFIVDDSSASVSPIHQRVAIDRPENLTLAEGTAIVAAPGDGSSPDDSQEYFPMTTSMTRELRLELENLDRHVFGSEFHTKQQRQLYTLSSCPDLETPPESEPALPVAHHDPSAIAYSKLQDTVTSTSTLCVDVASSMEIQSIDEICDRTSSPEPVVVRYREKPGRRRDVTVGSSIAGDQRDSKRVSTTSTNVSSDVFVWENPLHQCDDESPMSVGTTGGLGTAGELTQIPQQQQQQQRTATTPDEHPELEYDGEIIEETTLGKKSVTPIRLVRKNGDRSVPNSNRNSMILPDSSDSSDDSPLARSPAAVKFKFHPNNPFFDATTNALDNRPPQNSTLVLTRDPDLITTDGVLLEQATEASAGSGIDGGSLDQHMPNDGLTSVEPQVASAVLESPATTIVESTAQPPIVPQPSLPLQSAPGISLSPTVAMKIAGVIPPPLEFGGGNPFLMFLCLTILLQHRDYIMKTGMDYNEMAMHFDKMVRKHNVTRVLNQARQMYAEYRRLYQQQRMQQQQLHQNASPGGGRASLSMTSSYHGMQNVGLRSVGMDSFSRKASAPEVSSARRNTGGDLTLVT
ncbi:TBC1 domain family [Anopheles darlingi]|uniref:TBC1 domain family n=1 Tax=Anopheles darlingi TaxID=43151 RepID=W5JD13_ANODA|nr:TBC1 domain family [Anopheles darlingi]